MDTHRIAISSELTYHRETTISSPEIHRFSFGACLTAPIVRPLDVHLDMASDAARSISCVASHSILAVGEIARRGRPSGAGKSSLMMVRRVGARYVRPRQVAGRDSGRSTTTPRTAAARPYRHRLQGFHLFPP